jgi:dTDP-3-amino-2,3,6-trideoxy-4-keto-D-glucose/dTDP-3-amino-3,4,6-trideoxy-alpha-D-glucose/dTDP-2,6-dideoxy-D-kanosamine transaminase
MKNFLPSEYKKNRKLKINHSYLVEQFADYSKIFKEVEKVVKKGDYTLGNEVNICEKNFAKRTGAKFAISVGNGTDALLLTLKALGIGPGDEVITVPYTFVATVGSIVTAGATPVFVDIKEDYNIDENKIKSAITKKTKAIMPVHWAGRPCEMDKIYSLAKKYKLNIIQDSAHVIGAKFKKKHLVNFGDACTYSMHPLKNLNVWGDGGFIVTNKKSLAKKLYLIRNHGLKNRDNVEIFGYNSRLDTIQAAVANYKMKNKLDNITKKRIQNATMLDKMLSNNKNVITVKRLKHLKEVFHLYHINVFKKRDSLQKYLIKNNIDAKVHYPIPVHLQKAAKYLKYKKGDFPVSEKLANTSISLPVHEFIDKRHVNHMVNIINKFYQKR